MRKQWKQWRTLHSWAPKSLQMTTAMKLKDTSPWKKSYDQHRQYVKKQSHYFADKGPSCQSYGFSSSHVGDGNGNQLQYSCLENPRDRSLVGCRLWGHLESDMTEQLDFHFPLSCIGEGNGNPLQCSCLENPRDRSLVGCRLWGHTEWDTTDVT